VAFTWSCSTWPDPTIQTIVTVTIEPDGAGASIMTIEHELLPLALVRQHAHGWTVISMQLETRLRSAESRSRGPRLSAMDPTAR
jgi:activator of Hsp90 ATPase-like protein